MASPRIRIQLFSLLGNAHILFLLFRLFFFCILVFFLLALVCHTFVLTIYPSLFRLSIYLKLYFHAVSHFKNESNIFRRTD